MTKEEMLKVIADFQIKSYHVTESEDGDFTLRFGYDDPIKEIERLKMDNAVMKSQTKYLMSILFNVPYEKVEDLIK